MSTGFGRGGRGAALQQALQAPARKPGEQALPSTQQTTPLATPTVSSTAAPGRGHALALQSLLEKKSAGTQPAAPPTGAPMGRASLLQMAMQSQKAAVAAGSAPAGRGHSQLLLGTQTPVPQKTEPPVVPAMGAVPGEEGSRLAERLSRLSVDKPVVQNHGTSGQRVLLAANSIRMKCAFKGMFQYAVSFTPQVDSRRMRFKMVADHATELGSVRTFDGSTLCLLQRLPQDETVLVSHRETDGEEVTIRVKLVKVLPMAACIQPLNVLFRKIMEQLKLVQVNRHYYNPSRKAEIPQHKLEVWPGYITAIEEQEGGLLLLCDVSHRVLRTQTVRDAMKTIMLTNRSGNFQEEFKKAFIGVTVLTRYNNKTYRVDDIAFDKSPKDTFLSSDGQQIRFVDYYKNMYNKVITDLDQPLLLHKVKNRERRGGRGDGDRPSMECICLVPELSYMTGLNDDMRKDFRLMKELASHTRVTPAQRQRAMRKFVADVNSHPVAVSQLEKWGVQLDPDLVTCEGRQLPPEQVVFGGGRECSAGLFADWSREITRNNHVISSNGLRDWLLVFTQRDAGKVRDFLTLLKQEAPKMGIDVAPPFQNGLAIPNDRTESYLTAIRQSATSRTQMVVCVFPTSRDDRYNAFKKLCCVEFPVPSQAINLKTVSDQKKLRSVTQKILLQINCKMGGELWGVKIPTKRLMVVGIDVYHDKGTKQFTSIAGMVASTNSNCTRWYSRTCRQLPGLELIDSIRPCFTAALKKYHEMNHALPERIFVFRDGVGDGQLGSVAQHEAPQLDTCFKDFGEGYNPQLVVIVVQKRINQRIFATESVRSGQESLKNPDPGTVVDNTITRRDWYDFFLVSQHVNQGTVSPTHYVVVHDGGSWDCDKVQKLAYKLTHLYYNWPGTIRVPAPCQYAHKLAYQVGQNIRADFNLNLADRLFFL